MSKDNAKPASTENLVRSASVELSESELEQVAGGDTKTPPKQPVDKTEYLKITLKDALITGY